MHTMSCDPSPRRPSPGRVPVTSPVSYRTIVSLVRKDGSPFLPSPNTFSSVSRRVALERTSIMVWPESGRRECSALSPGLKGGSLFPRPWGWGLSQDLSFFLSFGRYFLSGWAGSLCLCC